MGLECKQELPCVSVAHSSPPAGGRIRRLRAAHSFSPPGSLGGIAVASRQGAYGFAPRCGETAMLKEQMLTCYNNSCSCRLSVLHLVVAVLRASLYAKLQ